MATNRELWGITGAGFYCPSYGEILSEKEKKAKLLFGEDFNTSEQTPQGKFIRINVQDDLKLYQQMEQLYYSRYPDTATGISLDRICKIAGVYRNPATYARHTIRVYGTRNHVIPMWTQFKNRAGLIFYATTSETINIIDNSNDVITYYTDIVVQSETAGEAGNVTNIDTIVEVDPDVTDVMYLRVDSFGEDVESDAKLRERFSKVILGLGINTAASIVASVSTIDGVNDVIIVDNNSPDTPIVISGTLTVAPRSYCVIVHSDDNSQMQDIAEAIYRKQPLGICQSGNVVCTVEDDSGEEHTVKYNYVDQLQINITLECAVNEDFSGNSADLVTVLTKYIDGLGIGQDLIYSRLYREIYSVAGIVDVNTLTVNGGTSNIAINKVQIAKAGTISATFTEAVDL